MALASLILQKTRVDFETLETHQGLLGPVATRNHKETIIESLNFGGVVLVSGKVSEHQLEAWWALTDGRLYVNSWGWCFNFNKWFAVCSCLFSTFSVHFWDVNVVKKDCFFRHHQLSTFSNLALLKVACSNWILRSSFWSWRPRLDWKLQPWKTTDGCVCFFMFL